MSALERFLSLIDDEYEPGLFERTIKPASACQPPECIHSAPVSVFQLATRELSVCARPNTKPKATHALQVTREPGIVRCKLVPISETDEWKEKEFQRRARQIVPRPTRQKRLHLKNSRNWKQLDGAAGLIDRSLTDSKV